MTNQALFQMCGYINLQIHTTGIVKILALNNFITLMVKRAINFWSTCVELLVTVIRMQTCYQF
jgi:hypothetical protein